MKKWLLIVGCIVLFSVPLFVKSDNEQPARQTVEEACEIVVLIGEERLPLEQYLVGVVAAEMPASFHVEALKAQAIAARTYALRKIEAGELIQATTAHQVYENRTQREEKWQAVFAEYESKIEQAVRETAGLVATYNDALITAMFHAASDGITESAENYSGNAVPYLQSVQSTEQLEEDVSYTVQQLNKKLGTNFTRTQYEQARIQSNNSGRVATVKIGQKEWNGRAFRELLGLKSTAFTLRVAEQNISIRTKGYGHGVGMSQYGANDMANSGARAEDILKHYYQGIELAPYVCKKDV